MCMLDHNSHPPLRACVGETWHGAATCFLSLPFARSYEELLCNHMPMLRELVASLPAEQAAGAQRQLELQADELKHAVQAESDAKAEAAAHAKAAEADFVYDYYMCDAGEATEAASHEAAASSAEQENVSWQQRLAHLPVLHVRMHACPVPWAGGFGVWVVVS